jgi:hypothetical protein
MAKQPSPARPSPRAPGKPKSSMSAPPESEPVKKPKKRPAVRPIIETPEMPTLPPIHLQKLNAVIANDKLPPRDKPRLEAAKERYQQWIKDLDSVTGSTPQEILRRRVALLNEYRLYIDVNIIFDSEDDFLYRQMGQLKLNNSVIEEFLPHLMRVDILAEIADFDVEIGPARSFSALYFTTSLEVMPIGGGMSIRPRDDDFAISRRLHLKASHHADYPDTETVEIETNIAYVVSECKTNLDKTMFQGACATAHDVKSTVSGARYYLLAEWLDMTPVSTAPTDIDEVLLIRKGKRTNSNIRKDFSSADGRRRAREAYLKFLTDRPFRPEVFERYVNHIRGILKNETPVESDVLSRGYF